MTGNRETSEDLMQHSFVRCHQYLHIFRQDSNMQTWLRKVARNLVYDHFKRRRIVGF
ncbi:RNA polymerase sigma factor [Lysinibacillus sp. NPDC096418]|uniref:RNA polymerase sigma factor n=1 Tax=Lysinibacillus sp. NPDC096418 TaxID=3364138 RepID=UPI003820A3F6